MPIELPTLPTTPNENGEHNLKPLNRVFLKRDSVEESQLDIAVEESDLEEVNFSIGGQHCDFDDISESSSLSARSCAVGSVTSIAVGVANTFQHWKVLAFGQLISFFVFTGGAAASELEAQCGLNAPTFQLSITYVLLTLHLLAGIIRSRRSSSSKESDCDKPASERKHMYVHQYIFSDEVQCAGQNSEEATADSHKDNALTPSPQTFPFTSMPVEGQWWLYFLLAFLEVEANFFTVLAYRYTTITSIALLSSIAIPSAMLASKILLKWKYGVPHIIGVCICLSGAVINVLIDYEDDIESADYQLTDHKMLGDFIAVVGAILLGFLDALTELMCKKFSSGEYLSMLGFFGSIISLVQIYFVEMDELVIFFSETATCSKGLGISLLLAFSFANYLNYISQAHFLSISEAALMNLSLLTCDLYSVLFAVVFEKIIPDRLFYLALALIIFGIVIYESAASPMDKSENRMHERSKEILENVFDIRFIKDIELT